ncbi:MAG: methyltransferase domain-containing protein [Acidobacteria bacterium]|nr:methyltransferase domain-containing protein [Acidobacteriota bacterium]
MPWNPEQYHKFQSERFAPFEDLLKLVKVREGLRVIDLGCGTGELTRRLADYLPSSEVVGVDSSAEMLERAGSLAREGLKFERRAIEAVAGEWDLVFSHAAIQWVDKHEELVPRLFSLVAEGGQLAVQLPSNHSHPTHTLIREIAGEEPFQSALGGWTREPPVLSIGKYAELLYEQGASDLIVFEKIYPHVLESAEALAEWTTGTALVPYFERLPQNLRELFLQKYIARLKEKWPRSPVFYPFQRILFSATRPALASSAPSIKG